MGFWVFMLVMVLLVPCIMIVVGRVFIKAAPKDINPVFGYRTTMSMKNRETWEFAHTYCGKLWHVVGWILVPLSVIPMLFVLGKSEDAIGTVGSVICLVQLIPLVASIIPTEIALRKRFDKDGNRR